MSIHDIRMSKQPEINRKIYYDWLDSLTSKDKKSIESYKSAVTRFFENHVNSSILDIQFSLVDNYISTFKNLKLSQVRNITNYLKKFLVYVEGHYKTNWDFNSNDLLSLVPSVKKVKESVNTAKPLLFKELLSIYKGLKTQIHSDEKMMEAYIVFRLMLNYELNEDIICKIDKITYNVETGEFRYGQIFKKFDGELVEIFRNRGVNVLSYSKSSIRGRLKLLCSFINRNISYDDLQATYKLYQITCPGCGSPIKNSINQLGAVRVDILNFDGTILCKECLESLNND